MVDDDLLQQLSTEHTFQQSINWSLPIFKIHRKPGDKLVNDEMAILDKPSLPLASVINKTLRDDMIFQSESDRLSHELTRPRWFYDFSFPNLTVWLTAPPSIGFCTGLTRVSLLPSAIYIIKRIHIYIFVRIPLQLVYIQPFTWVVV